MFRGVNTVNRRVRDVGGERWVFPSDNVDPTDAEFDQKSKCDGRQPRCTTCIAYKDECHYDKPPSLAYVRSLEEEIAELKQQLRQARIQAWLNKVRLGV